MRGGTTTCPKKNLESVFLYDLGLIFSLLPLLRGRALVPALAPALAFAPASAALAPALALMMIFPQG